MRHLLATAILLSTLSFSLAAAADATPATPAPATPPAPTADDAKFELFVPGRTPALTAAKAATVKEGMTLQELVMAIGPGHLGSEGVVHWDFPGNNRLNVLSEHRDKLDLITFKGTGIGALAWWSVPDKTGAAPTPAPKETAAVKKTSALAPAPKPVVHTVVKKNAPSTELEPAGPAPTRTYPDTVP